MAKKKQIKRCSLTGKVINPNDEVILITKVKDYVAKQGYILVKAEELTKSFLVLILFMLLFSFSLNLVKSEEYIQDKNSFYINVESFNYLDYQGYVNYGSFRTLIFNTSNNYLNTIFWNFAFYDYPDDITDDKLYNMHFPSIFIRNNSLISSSDDYISLSSNFEEHIITNFKKYYLYNSSLYNTTTLKDNILSYCIFSFTSLYKSKLNNSIYYLIQTPITKTNFCNYNNLFFQIRDKEKDNIIYHKNFSCNSTFCPSVFLKDDINGYWFLAVYENNLTGQIYFLNKDLTLNKSYTPFTILNASSLYSITYRPRLYNYSDYLYFYSTGYYAIFNKTSGTILKTQDYYNGSQEFIQPFNLSIWEPQYNFPLDNYYNPLMDIFVYNGSLYKLNNLNIIKYNDFLFNSVNSTFDFFEKLQISLYFNNYIEYLARDRDLKNEFDTYFIKDNLLYIAGSQPTIVYVSGKKYFVEVVTNKLKVLSIYLNNLTIKDELGPFNLESTAAIYYYYNFNCQYHDCNFIFYFIEPLERLGNITIYNLTLNYPLNNTALNYPFNTTFNITKQGNFKEIYLNFYTDNLLINTLNITNNFTNNTAVFNYSFIDYYKDNIKNFNISVSGINEDNELIRTYNISLYLNNTPSYNFNITSPLNNSLIDYLPIPFTYEVLINEIPFKNVTSYLNNEVLNYSDNETFFNFTKYLNRSNYNFKIIACNILNECFNSSTINFIVEPLNYSFNIISPINTTYNLTDTKINFTFEVFTNNIPFKNLTAFLNNQLVVYSENETFFNYTTELSEGNYSFYINSCNILNECFNSSIIHFEVIKYKEPFPNYLKMDLDKSINLILLGLLFLTSIVFLFLGYSIVTAFILIVIGFIFLLNDLNPLISGLFIIAGSILIFRE